MAVKPLPTALGLKRRIDQSVCNADFSCRDGFCPSFVTVVGKDGTDPFKSTARLTRAPDMLPAEPIVSSDEAGILIAGIGGTGVVTIGAVLLAAAAVEGVPASALDQTGLAQKNGAVASHVRIGNAEGRSLKLQPGETTMLIAADPVVGASPSLLQTLHPGAARSVVNVNAEPLASFAKDARNRPDGERIAGAIVARVGAEFASAFDFTAAAEALFGDTILTNALMLGAALQMGGIPLQAASVEKALTMNGVAVEANIEAFRWGRVIVAEPRRIADLLPSKLQARAEPRTYPELRADLAARLTAYQGRHYAQRFLAALRPLEKAESMDEEKPLSTLAARSLYKAMAYKDEYEVARLYSTAEFRARLAAEFPERAGLRVHLAPRFWRGATRSPAIRARSPLAAGYCRSSRCSRVSGSCAERPSTRSGTRASGARNGRSLSRWSA